MAKIEQFKAELNRRIELYGNPLGVADVRLQDERKGMLKALSDMLAFIDSLPAETASPELDAEIAGYLKSIYHHPCDNLKEKMIARHFAEWGAEHLRDTTKMIPEGLDEAAENYAHSLGYDEDKDKAEIAGAKEDFVAGANRQKQHDAELIEIAYNDGISIGMTKQKGQMLKEAVEVVVVDDWQYGKDTDGAKPAIKVRNLDWKIGDKKNVIILKDE